MLETTTQAQNVLDSISDGFFTLDHRWRFTYVNPAAVPLLRHYSQDLLGQVIWDALPATRGSLLELHLRQVVRNHAPAAFEIFEHVLDMWLAVRAYPTLGDGGVAVYLQDITDRKRAEIDRQRLAAIVTSSQDAIVGVDPDGSVTDWNAGAEKLYGYAAAEAIGQPLGRVLQSANGEQIARCVLHCIQADRRVARHETSAVRKDGLVVEVMLSASPLRSEAGQVIGGAIMAQDLTAPKAAETQLRLLGAALEAAANAIVISDVNGSIEWVNPAFTRLTGYSLTEVRGQNPRLLKSGKHGPELYARLWNTILAGNVFRGKIVNRRKDGALYLEQMTITPVRAADGAISHFIAVKESCDPRPLTD
jgi:PAS domain S-box-containing protein